MPHIKTCGKTMVIKTAWDWHTDQWNPIATPQINPHIYTQLIFNKGAKNSQFVFFDNKYVWENQTYIFRRMKLDLYLLPHTKINSK